MKLYQAIMQRDGVDAEEAKDQAGLIHTEVRNAVHAGSGLMEIEYILYKHGFEPDYLDEVLFELL